MEVAIGILKKVTLIVLQLLEHYIVVEQEFYFMGPATATINSSTCSGKRGKKKTMLVLFSMLPIHCNHNILIEEIFPQIYIIFLQFFFSIATFASYLVLIYCSAYL